MTTHVCKVTGKDFIVTDDESEWYKRFDLPHPDLSVDERLRRKMAFLNDRRFFWRKCSNTQSRIFSTFAPRTDFPVYTEEAWHSKSWDRFEYGTEFNPRQPFFEQLFDLWSEVPRPATWNSKLSHSSSVSDLRNGVDSFVVTNSQQVTKSCYSVGISECAKCCDCYWCTDSNSLYECVDCHSCGVMLFGSHCGNCHESAFLTSCYDCRHCLFCANLQGREFCVFNQQLTPEAYAEEVRRWNFSLRPVLEEARNRYTEFLSTMPTPAIAADLSSNDETISSGNYLTCCSDVHHSFLCTKCDGIRSSTRLLGGSRVLDAFGCLGKLVDCAQVVGLNGSAERVFNAFYCGDNVSDLMYCAYCDNSRHLFGCISLSGAEYCIFNKQYSATEYFQIRSEIESTLKRKRVWGKFFPAAFSDFSYNHSAAADYMPLNKYQCEMLSYKWDETDESLKPSQLLGASVDTGSSRFAEPPVRLDEVSEESVPEAIYLCEITGRPYQITTAELTLYREFGVVPPSRCFEQRHRERLAQLAPFRLVDREIEGVTLSTAFENDWRRPVVRRATWRNSIVGQKT